MNFHLNILNICYGQVKECPRASSSQKIRKLQSSAEAATLERREMAHLETVKRPNEEWEDPSQNHRIMEWLELEETSEDHLVQTAAKAGSPRAGAQDHVQECFDYLHNLSVQPLSVLCHPHSKEVFLLFRWMSLCFVLCP